MNAGSGNNATKETFDGYSNKITTLPHLTLSPLSQELGRDINIAIEVSPAEAHLARALCHGETLEEYAEAQSVKLPTVKTQLRAVFAKTQTDRQVALVSLISRIPPLR